MSGEAAAWEWLLGRAAARRGAGTATTPDEPPDWDLTQVYSTFAQDGGVFAQMGQSLDGRIATPTGHSHYVNDGPAIDHLHRLRALADVVLVGAGTVVADDPALTVRRVAGENPVRAIIDPRGRVPATAGVFTDSQAPTLHIVGPGVDSAPGAERLELRFDHADACARILDALRERGHRAVFVEGGGRTVSGFLAAGLLDRLHIAVAPVIIGSGISAFHLAPIERMDQALRVACRSYQLGTDTLFDLDLTPRT